MAIYSLDLININNREKTTSKYVNATGRFYHKVVKKDVFVIE